MRRLITAFIPAFMLISLLPSSGFSERGIQIQERRLALIVGNGAYKNSPLRNPVNDAHDIANILRKLGFEVIYKENAGQRVMEKAIREFGKRLRKGGVGLFYFSGHGMQVNGRIYLIPVGARIHQETDMKYEAVDAGRVLDEMYNAGNNFNIVILDACRDNPFARSFRSSSRGLAQMDAPTGSLIVYATAPGSVAADGTGRNGIFTKHLLSYIETPGLDIELMLRSVRAGVNDETQGKQMPWSSSSLRGDFSFNPLATPHEGSATIISSVPKPTEKKIYERPAKPKRGPDDVEIAELSENGLLPCHHGNGDKFLGRCNFSACVCNKIRHKQGKKYYDIGTC